MQPVFQNLVPAIYLGAVCVGLPAYCAKKLTERNEQKEPTQKPAEARGKRSEEPKNLKK
jgi:hypothetical protein